MPGEYKRSCPFGDLIESGETVMRIVTRPDFDGIVCAVLLKAAEQVSEDIHWVEPGDMQKGQVAVKKGDVIANLPFNSRCSLWFDHHYTNKPAENFAGAFKIAPSAAGVVYDYYKSTFQSRGQDRFSELVFYADKIDSADLSIAEVRKPEDYPYIILSMTISGRNKKDAPYWSRLVDLFLEGDITTIVEDPEVATRIAAAMKDNLRLENYLCDHTTLQGSVSVTDFRPFEKTPEGNRFLVYSLFPEACVSVKIRYDNPERKKIVLSIGHSIFNKTCKVNAGLLLSSYGGGGHFGAAACSFPGEFADTYIPEIIEILKKNEPIQP
jgi:hypothetical protein